MSDWTPTRIEKLTRMWGAGCTASKIGAELGITASAVIGKAHRLGLPGRPSPINHTRPRKPWHPKDPAAVRRSLIAAQTTANQRGMAKPAAKPAQRALARTASPFKTCQYLHGEPSKRNFCGKPAQRGSSWCDHHDEVCHQKMPKPEAAESEAA